MRSSQRPSPAATTHSLTSMELLLALKDSIESDGAHGREAEEKALDRSSGDGPQGVLQPLGSRKNVAPRHVRLLRGKRRSSCWRSILDEVRGLARSPPGPAIRSPARPRAADERFPALGRGEDQGLGLGQRLSFPARKWCAKAMVAFKAGEKFKLASHARIARGDRAVPCSRSAATCCGLVTLHRAFRTMDARQKISVVQQRLVSELRLTTSTVPRRRLSYVTTLARPGSSGAVGKRCTSSAWNQDGGQSATIPPAAGEVVRAVFRAGARATGLRHDEKGPRGGTRQSPRDHRRGADVINGGARTVRVPVRMLEHYHFPPLRRPEEQQGAGQGQGPSREMCFSAPGRGAGGRVRRDPGRGAMRARCSCLLEFQDRRQSSTGLWGRALKLPNLKAARVGAIRGNRLDPRGPGTATGARLRALDRRRSFKELVKRRGGAGGHADPFIDEDLRYPPARPGPARQPALHAVVFFMLDVSGSMFRPRSQASPRPSSSGWCRDCGREYTARSETLFVAHHPPRRGNSTSRTSSR